MRYLKLGFFDILFVLSLLLARTSNGQIGSTSERRTVGQGESSGQYRSRASRLVAQKCVFILATGQSGSTALMDAVNQLPAYLIRGEQWAALWNVYESYMNFNWTTAVPLSQLKFNWTRYRYASFETVKNVYNREAHAEKLPWFNEFPSSRILAASRSYYAVLYGYYGKNFVSGFKDSRYVCGRSFESGRCAEFFYGFMDFLRHICLDVKVILNSRTSSSMAANVKLFDMDNSRPEDLFLKDLNQTHALYDEYVQIYPDHAFRVYYEDMYDPKKNSTVATNLLKFLKEDPATPISFIRMPASKPRQ